MWPVISGFTSGSLDGHLNSGSDDLFAMHLATDGTWRWTQQRGTRYQDRATAMVVMGEEMYVTGYTKGDLVLRYCWGRGGLWPGVCFFPFDLLCTEEKLMFYFKRPTF